MATANLKYFDLNAEAFAVGSVPVAEIAGRVGTPFYVYDGGIIEQKFERLRRTLRGCHVLYSLKCNPSVAVCSLLKSLGAGADVASYGELLTAQRAGFAAQDTVFVGPGKSDRELEAAIDAGIFAIAAESTNELQRIDAIAGERSKPARVLVRINVKENIEVAWEKMAGGPSRFGIDEEAAADALSRLSLEAAEIVGIHTYAASQVLDAKAILRHIDHSLGLARALSQQVGFELKCIDFGGGFGVPYADTDEELDTDALGSGLDDLLAKYAVSRDGVKLVFESGRYLAAECGVFVTKVVDVKASRGKTFVITDGGINQFLRPQFMKVKHPALILNKHRRPPTAVVDIGGPCCTPVDCIAAEVRVPRPEVGDLVGVFNCGAYGYSMSPMNFLSHPWPAEVFVHKGKMRVVRERKEAEDFLREQIDASDDSSLHG